MLLQIQMTGTQNVKKKIECTLIFCLFNKRMMNF
jgi:hypothetical protein